MAEIFATIAGVASSIDVALRACNAIYDLIRYIHDLPELCQGLQRTIHSIESVLQSTETFVVQYRQLQSATGQLNLLPGAVNNEIISIENELTSLKALLRGQNSGNTLRRRFHGALDKAKVAEVVQRLDSHQLTLILALQSFAQRINVRLHDDFHRKLEDLSKQREGEMKALKDELNLLGGVMHNELDGIAKTGTTALEAQEKFNSRFASHQDMVSAAADATNSKLDVINTSLSQIKVRGCHVSSSTVVTEQIEGILARVVRAELRRFAIPSIKQCLDTFKSDTGKQLDDIYKKIDEMANQLESESDRHARIDAELNQYLQQDDIGLSTRNEQDLVELATKERVALSMNEPSEGPHVFHRRRIKLWRRIWVFRWAIGTLRVSVSSFVTRGKTGPVFHVGQNIPPQSAYRVNVDFQSAQSLIRLRGLVLSVEKTEDQRGYYQICPMISSFAVVPSDGDVMMSAFKNDVERLQDLFMRRLAAPTDRDKDGITPLMVAARMGASEACQLLLNEGADPLAVDNEGNSSLDFAISRFCHPDLEESFQRIYSRDWETSLGRGFIESYTPDWWAARDRRYSSIIQLLHQVNEDIVEDCNTSFLIFIWGLGPRSRNRTSFGLTPDTLFIQQLKVYGFKLTTANNDITPFIQCAINLLGNNEPLPPEFIKNTVQVLQDLGADSNQVDVGGMRPLHWLFPLLNPFDLGYDISNLVQLAIALLEAGADPCALGNDGTSIFDIAQYSDLLPEWHEALREAGHDIDEIELETKWRQWCFHNPDHAIGESTAIDEDRDTSLAIKNLAHRRVGRGDRLEE